MSQVLLKVLTGPHGTNKLHLLQGAGRPQSLVVYFPGDVITAKSTEPRIKELQDHQHVARMLADKFGAGGVCVVEPSRYEAGAACFDHFLGRTTVQGEPLNYHGTTFKASEQLGSLLLQAFPSEAVLPPCHVVGFSKGGVVLNQLLSELGALQVLREAATAGAEVPAASAALLLALHSVHYLDCGLNTPGAYLTDPLAIRRLGHWCRAHEFRLFLHGTPRQWGDASRPWIHVEKDRFMELCLREGVSVCERLHFAGCPPSLYQHFSVISDFCAEPPCD